jgi:putative ABC transport system permease protein
MTALLFEVSPYDLFSYVSVAVVLMAAALLACWLPARCAMRIEPAVALKTE